MATVIKGNTLLTVPDDRVSDYVARGYDVASAEGIVIQKAVPSDREELQKRYTEHVAKIANLEKAVKQRDDKIAELESELETLQADYDNLSDAYKNVESSTVEEAPAKKKRTTKKADTE